MGRGKNQSFHLKNVIISINSSHIFNEKLAQKRGKFLYAKKFRRDRGVRNSENSKEFVFL